MNIEIKISGETTDAKFLAVLAAISAITAGNSQVDTAPVVTPVIKFDSPAPAKASPKKSVADQVTEALDAAPVEPETPQPAPAVKASPTKSKYTLEVVRAEAIAVSKLSNEKREEVKALIATHGGVKVTDLSADVYDAFMADLAKLK